MLLLLLRFVLFALSVSSTARVELLYRVKNSLLHQTSARFSLICGLARLSGAQNSPVVLDHGSLVLSVEQATV